MINYWQDDVKKGIQYKLIFKSISGSIDEKVKDKISDLVDETFALNKENIVSDKTLDYNVWAKKADFNKSSKIYRHFRDENEKYGQIVSNQYQQEIDNHRSRAVISRSEV